MLPGTRWAHRARLRRLGMRPLQVWVPDVRSTAFQIQAHRQCAFTTDPAYAPPFRLPVRPNERNGLRAGSRLMVDKIATVPKSKIGARVGRLDAEDLARLNRAILVFLGLAGTSLAAR